MAAESFVFSSIENHRTRSDFEMHELYIKQAAAQIFAGCCSNSLENELMETHPIFPAAYETTVISIMTFALAMLTHPDIQRKAQQEIDSVIGPNRLPDFLDMERLPYLSAVVKEVLR